MSVGSRTVSRTESVWDRIPLSAFEMSSPTMSSYSRMMLTVPAISHTVKNSGHEIHCKLFTVIVQADDADRPSNQPHCKKPFPCPVNDNCDIVQAVDVDCPSNQPHCKK